jgi:hypothetical protein
LKERGKREKGREKKKVEERGREKRILIFRYRT